MNLYLKGFTVGSNAQYISVENAERTLLKLLKMGFGIIALQNEQLAGFLFAFPVEPDEEFPSELKNEFTNSLYIAEVVVGAEFRERGIATKMLEEMQHTAIKLHYDNLILRVWDENVAALNLYRKAGFKDTGVTIRQTKFKDELTPFGMTKIYLYKNIE